MTARMPGTVIDVSATLVDEHDSLPRTALKNLALLLPRQPRIQTQYLDARSKFALQQFADIANLALARKKDQDVAAADFSGFGGDFLIGLEHRLRQIGVLVFVLGFPIAHFDGMAAAAHRDDRRVAEELRHAFDIERRRRHDEFQSGRRGSSRLSTPSNKSTLSVRSWASSTMTVS